MYFRGPDQQNRGGEGRRGHEAEESRRETRPKPRNQSLGQIPQASKVLRLLDRAWTLRYLAKVPKLLYLIPSSKASVSGLPSMLGTEKFSLAWSGARNTNGDHRRCSRLPAWSSPVQTVSLTLSLPLHRVGYSDEVDGRRLGTALQSSKLISVLGTKKQTRELACTVSTRSGRRLDKKERFKCNIELLEER